MILIVYLFIYVSRLSWDIIGTAGCSLKFRPTDDDQGQIKSSINKADMIILSFAPSFISPIPQ